MLRSALGYGFNRSLTTHNLDQADGVQLGNILRSTYHALMSE